MSVEAIAYVKSLDLRECEKARLLLFIIAENTFNDTFVCVIGQRQLAYEARACERTVRRQIDELVAARILIRKPRYPEKSGGRLPDALRIVGFKRWYLASHKATRKKFLEHAEASGQNGRKTRGSTGQNVRKPLPDKMSGSPGGLPAKMSGSPRGGLPDTAMSGVTGQQVSGSYKESRTYPVNKKNAREGALSEDSNLDLEGKGVLDRLRHRFGGEIFESWFADVSFRLVGGTAVAEAPNKFVAGWLSSHFEPTLLAACQAEWPGIARVKIVSRSEKTKGAAA